MCVSDIYLISKTKELGIEMLNVVKIVWVFSYVLSFKKCIKVVYSTENVIDSMKLGRFESAVKMF